jgi:hypothetical protein
VYPGPASWELENPIFFKREIWYIKVDIKVVDSHRALLCTTA